MILLVQPSHIICTKGRRYADSGTTLQDTSDCMVVDVSGMLLAVERTEDVSDDSEGGWSE